MSLNPEEYSAIVFKISEEIVKDIFKRIKIYSFLDEKIAYALFQGITTVVASKAYSLINKKEQLNEAILNFTNLVNLEWELVEKESTNQERTKCKN